MPLDQEVDVLEVVGIGRGQVVERLPDDTPDAGRGMNGRQGSASGG
jgi:hypothetical protein